MTGWRIGYAAGAQAIIAAIESVQSQSTSNPTSISHVAAEAALNGDQGCIAPMVKAFRERHRFVVDTLNAIPGFRAIDSGGAFYAFPDASEAISALHAKGKITQPNDLSFSEYLLERAGVECAGFSVGAEGNCGSFANSMEN